MSVAMAESPQKSRGQIFDEIYLKIERENPTQT
jgi:hypothetical protein